MPILRNDWLDIDFTNAKSGIYRITNIVNNKIYVGSASYIRERWNIHLLRLRRGVHHSKHLQNAYNKYGEQSFKFSIIEVINVDGDKKMLRNALVEREQYYLDILKPYDRDIGYNHNPIAQSMLGYKHSEETCKKNSEAQKKQQRLHPRNKEQTSCWGKFGKLHSRAISIIQLDLDNKEIKTWDSISDIDRFFGKVVRPNILKCCSGKYRQAYGFLWKKNILV